MSLIINHTTPHSMKMDNIASLANQHSAKITIWEVKLPKEEPQSLHPEDP